jgi:hypothetical protein
MPMIEINLAPSRRHLRVFGVGALVVFGLLGVWLFFAHRLLGFEMTASAAEAVACVLWALAALAGILAAAAPAALRPLYIAMAAVSLPIGWLVSHVVLGTVYYGILMPIGLVMRVIGRDPLCRKFDPHAPSYWVDRPAARDVKRYFRQF